MGQLEGQLGRMARSIQAWQRALGEGAEAGEVLEVGGFVGSVVPAAPSRSILNAAAAPYGSPVDVPDVERLAARYAQSGTEVWGVWAHERDPANPAHALARAGLVVDSEPVAMTIDLATLRRPEASSSIEVLQTDDPALLAQPLGAGYGFPPELVTRGLPRLLEHTQGWVALLDGAPAAGLGLVAEDGDVGVFMVATAPEMRRRGAAGSLLAHALLSARGAGCTTSTLQSSAMGLSVYAGLGYAAVGAYQLWEHRGS